MHLLPVLRKTIDGDPGELVLPILTVRLAPPRQALDSPRSRRLPQALEEFSDGDSGVRRGDWRS
ncbi:MAG TPA: hypothetical protein VNP04_23350 [Alphaproteobacteria bacterium]|nr:hypothetical protein [Alphaproteobacteria bacterium]